MNYEEARNEANRLVRKTKYEYEHSIAINLKEDSQMFWKLIQSKTKTNENSPCIIDHTFNYIDILYYLTFVAA
jgi:hypothetical protein